MSNKMKTKKKAKKIELLLIRFRETREKLEKSPSEGKAGKYLIKNSSFILIQARSFDSIYFQSSPMEALFGEFEESESATSSALTMRAVVERERNKKRPLI
jgi:hypothetical protein